MRLPLSLIIIFFFVTICANWDEIGLLLSPSPISEKIFTTLRFIALTPNRTFTSMVESWNLYQEGSQVALGLAVIWGIGLLVTFTFVYKFIGWLIGLLKPVASEERKSVISFLAALGLLAVAIGMPVEPTTVLAVVILFIGALMIADLLKKREKHG